MKVSVVTPFHDAAPYLRDCIESVLAQTFTDFEYVLLDNCSRDGSGDIAAEYARRDDRIRLVRAEILLPQVPNYNRALRLISGESTYCKMVQADDMIMRRCLEEMVCLADQDPDVGIVSALRFVGRSIGGTGLTLSEQILEGREVCRRQLLEGYFFFGSPTTIMQRAELVRSRPAFYEEGRFHEDTESCYEILKRWKFGYVHQVLSFSRTDNESTMSRVRSFNPAIVDKLIVLQRFGAEFLSVEEFRDCLARHETEYASFLAAQQIAGREPAFWDYHRRALATAGRSLDEFPIGRVAWTSALRSAASSWKPLGGAWRSWRRSR